MAMRTMTIHTRHRQSMWCLALVVTVVSLALAVNGAPTRGPTTILQSPTTNMHKVRKTAPQTAVPIRPRAELTPAEVVAAHLYHVGNIRGDRTSLKAFSFLTPQTKQRVGNADRLMHVLHHDFPFLLDHMNDIYTSEPLTAEDQDITTCCVNVLIASPNGLDVHQISICLARQPQALVSCPGCWMISSITLANQDRKDAGEVDADNHGCLVEAGYEWCERLQSCQRSWEAPCIVTDE